MSILPRYIRPYCEGKPVYWMVQPDGESDQGQWDLYTPRPTVLCEAKRRYLLTGKVSRYYRLALHCSTVDTKTSQPLLLTYSYVLGTNNTLTSIKQKFFLIWKFNFQFFNNGQKIYGFI